MSAKSCIKTFGSSGWWLGRDLWWMDQFALLLLSIYYYRRPSQQWQIWMKFLCNKSRLHDDWCSFPPSLRFRKKNRSTSIRFDWIVELLRKKNFFASSSSEKFPKLVFAFQLSFHDELLRFNQRFFFRLCLKGGGRAESFFLGERKDENRLRRRNRFDPAMMWIELCFPNWSSIELLCFFDELSYRLHPISKKPLHRL